MDTTGGSGYAAYQRLMAVLSFAEIPASFPGALLGADIVAKQATHLRRWLRANPQKGELLSALRLAATAREQLAGLRFDRAEASMCKAAVRIQAHKGDLRLPPHDGAVSGVSVTGTQPSYKPRSKVQLLDARPVVQSRCVMSHRWPARQRNFPAARPARLSWNAAIRKSKDGRRSASDRRRKRQQKVRPGRWPTGTGQG